MYVRVVRTIHVLGKKVEFLEKASKFELQVNNMVYVRVVRSRAGICGTHEDDKISQLHV